MNNLDLDHFKKKHDYLICIDSDGTVIDAMNAKHLHCHGPAFIDNWNLNQHKEEVQTIWNNINLFEESRGVNRFIALVQMLDLLNGKYLEEDQIDILRNWVESTNDLSNTGLENYMSSNKYLILEKALAWSKDINLRIAKLSTADKPPFEGVKEFLAYAKGKADIAIVSSSNIEAIYHEWNDHDLLEYVDVLASQEVGTKSECLARFIEKGYLPEQILMIGDAYPDLDAAKENDTFFYPILIRKEKFSWDQLKDKYFNLFIKDEYKIYQNEVMDLFKTNFGQKEISK